MGVVSGVGWNCAGGDVGTLNFRMGDMGRNFGMGGVSGVGQKNGVRQKNGLGLNILLFNHTL